MAKMGWVDFFNLGGLVFEAPPELAAPCEPHLSAKSHPLPSTCLYSLHDPKSSVSNIYPLEQEKIQHNRLPQPQRNFLFKALTRADLLNKRVSFFSQEEEDVAP